MALINGIVRGLFGGGMVTTLALFTACAGNGDCDPGEEDNDGTCESICEDDEEWDEDEEECVVDEDAGVTCWDGSTAATVDECPSEGWVPEYVGVSGFWGYDSEADATMPFSIDNAGTITPVPNRIVITFATQNYLQTGNEAESCAMVIEPAGALGFATWAQGINGYFGFTAPVGAEGGYIGDGCATMNAEMFGGDEPFVWVQKYEWGLSVGAIDPSLYTSLKGQIEGNANLNWDKNWKDKLLGGSWYSSALIDGDPSPGQVLKDTNYVRATAVDGDGVMQTDADDDRVYIDASVIATSPSTGVYESGSASFYQVGVVGLGAAK